jgi:hypothetical protein
MTESEWLACDDPVKMLALRGRGGPSLAERGRFDFSDRKLRLFACACCRQVWDGMACPERCSVLPNPPVGYKGKYLRWREGDGWNICGNCRGSGRIGGLTDERSRRAVEVAERYADGLVTEEDCIEIDGASEEDADTFDFGSAAYEAAWLASWTVHVNVGRNFVDNVLDHSKAAGLSPTVQAALLRDVFGNPFWPTTHPCPAPNCSRIVPGRLKTNHHWKCQECAGKGFRPGPSPSWLTWNDGTAHKLAQAIYDERAFDRLPLLADALEEAGCADAAILGHCRGKEPCWNCFDGPERRDGDECKEQCNNTGWMDAGPHARGCWVLDLLLGKE